MKKSRARVARNLLLFWTLFIGIGAVGGALMMLIDPSGKALKMDGMLPYFQVLPFADVLFCDFTFPGIALLLVNGVTNLTAAGLLIAKRRPGILLGGLFGITLMLWIGIQFYLFPPNFMSTVFFLFGAAQAITAYATWVFARQEAFRIDPLDYPNIGTDPTRLVVCFSRLGYTKKAAYEEADRTGAEIYEIRATERTAGTAGFLWCGRYGMHRWEMPIEPIGIDLTHYAHVTLCSPIWVFSLSAPMRTFCHMAAGKIREVDYILVHYCGASFTGAAQEADALLGIRHTALRSLSCRVGRYREIRNHKQSFTSS